MTDELTDFDIIEEPAIADLPSSPSEAFALGWRMALTRTPTPAVESDETHTNHVVSQNAPDLKHKAAPQEVIDTTDPYKATGAMSPNFPTAAPQDGAPETIWICQTNNLVVEQHELDDDGPALCDAAYTLKATSDERMASIQAECDENANQLDSALHSVDVLKVRIAMLQKELLLVVGHLAKIAAMREQFEQENE